MSGYLCHALMNLLLCYFAKLSYLERLIANCFISLSDSSTYAHFLFEAFDINNNGSVSFEVTFLKKSLLALLLIIYVFFSVKFIYLTITRVVVKCRVVD